jgi:hypothetical protein
VRLILTSRQARAGPVVPDSDAPVAGAESQISRKRKRCDGEFQVTSKRARVVAGGQRKL